MICHRRRGRYTRTRTRRAAAESRASNYECATDGTGREEKPRDDGGGQGKEKRRGFRAFVMENGGKY